MYKRLAILLGIFLFLLPLTVQAVQPTQQTNKIPIYPLYRESMASNTNYTYTMSINPPDGITSVITAIIFFNAQINGQTQNFTLWVNGQSCNTPFYYIATAFSATGNTQIYFDCSNVISKKGNYTITIRSAVNTGVVSGWLDLTYMNKPIGDIYKVGGTEYDVNDGYGKVFLQMLDNQKNPISNATCFSKIFYPNSSIWQNESMMTYATEGLHYSDFVIPNITGVFMVSAYCTIPISVNTTAWDNFECDGLNCGSGWVNNWSTSGACEVRSDGSPIGNYHMRCSYTGTLGEGNSSREINLSICTTGQLSFWAKAQGLEAGDFCRYQYWNGTAHAELLSITNPNDDNTYRFYSFEVCSAYGKSANSAIYFNASVNAAGDNCWIDNINFTLTNPSNLTEYQILRGSGEIHITNHIDNILGAIASVNQTLNTTILNYLVTINGTTFNINGTQYNSLLSAINSVNATSNQTYSLLVSINGSVFNLSIAELSHFNQVIAMLNQLNYTLNTTIVSYLSYINGTTFQTNQSQTAYYLSLLVSLEALNTTLNGSITQYLVAINGTTYNLSVNEFNHYVSLLQAINSVNHTLNTTILSYLIGINGTSYNTNQQIPLILQYLHDINITTNTTIPASLISINNTQNSNYLSLYNFLQQINQTGNTTLTFVASINQSLLNYYLDIRSFLESINVSINTTMEGKLDQINNTINQINQSLSNLNLTVNLTGLYDALSSINETINSTILNAIITTNNNVLNHNSSEYQHFLAMSVLLNDLNYGINTTLENKIDFINSTTWQTLLLLQNLTIGNVSVTASVNWTEGYKNLTFLSFSDKIGGDGITLTSETLTCISNTTLQHIINATQCSQGMCWQGNSTITEICEFGCKMNQCVPVPQLQYMTAIGIALIIFGGIYVAYRAWK